MYFEEANNSARASTTATEASTTAEEATGEVGYIVAIEASYTKGSSCSAQVAIVASRATKVNTGEAGSAALEASTRKVEEVDSRAKSNLPFPF